MNEILVACGDVALLKRILSELPKNSFKPIATKNGVGTAQKVANRQLAGAVVHAQLADGTADALVEQLRAQSPEMPILLLTSDAPPAEGFFDRALRYPVPGPVFRNALKSLLPTEAIAEDKEKWRAFYKEVKGLLNAAPNKSYYGVLGVEDGAPHHKLVTAFDRLSMRYHPDRYAQHRDKSWGEKLYATVNSLYKLLTEAYGVVSDRRLRKKYDRLLARGELRLDPEEVNPTDTGPQSLVELAQTQKSRRFLKMAQTAIAKRDRATAVQNLQFALSMEPDNTAIRTKLEELQAKS
jgi:hypothetical protein